MEMIERVARAICAVAAKITFDEGSSEYQQFIETDWEGFVEEAKAAIQAMREVTPEMVLRGAKGLYDRNWQMIGDFRRSNWDDLHEDVQAEYLSMSKYALDAALSPGKSGMGEG